MYSIQVDASHEALENAIWANLKEWWRYLGRSPATEFYDGQGLTWLLTGIPVAFLNPVMRTQLDSADVNVAIENTIAHFASKDMEKIFWLTGSDTRPANLEQCLVNHGLTSVGGPGMAVQLSELTEDLSVSAELTIERVADIDTLRKWDRVAIEGFGMDEMDFDSWLDLFAGLGFDLPMCNYVGSLHGKPVASSQLFLGAGVAGIYMVATIPEARRLGIGAAMTLSPLLDARALGFRIGVLQSSPMGLGVYQRLGFEEICDLSHYET